ncbi:MAG: 1-deoxy-D-xylulose-5-phosphate reductoisomerase [Nitrospirae bacterium]|nr:1-deoxy-D-xylulose-5-phosphate reductoisomerase [Nitrospirota bacterium]MCL5978811.1 1-deoxy-D-xylulose-5-phosphate reductoisomerase [Nitrospirota bacterium]
MKNIVILGSTGSIGRSALKVIDKFSDRFRVLGLVAGRNLPLLMEQIQRYRPRLVAVPDDDIYKELKSGIGDTKPEILCGIDGICSIAENGDADTVISAIVGSAGLLPTMSAIRAKKTVALANKETLVMAGDIVMSEVKKHDVALLPVDSEHSAVFQCMRGYERDSVRKIILTASGGPFVGRSAEELENVSPESALKHPNWNMGRKISIDSATLMNKGLEVIEAHHLFALPPEKIDVLIHPQSVVHSMVEFNDGSCIAQLSKPDMKGPIAYALSYPERLCDVIETIDWEKLSALTFKKPDNNTFPCLSIAYDALKTEGTMPAVLNASNEIAVAAFLDGIIGFNRIPAIIKKVMDFHKLQPADSIDVVLEADRWAREKTKSVIGL